MAGGPPQPNIVNCHLLVFHNHLLMSCSFFFRFQEIDHLFEREQAQASKVCNIGIFRFLEISQKLPNVDDTRGSKHIIHSFVCLYVTNYSQPFYGVALESGLIHFHVDFRFSGKLFFKGIYLRSFVTHMSWSLILLSESTNESREKDSKTPSQYWSVFMKLQCNVMKSENKQLKHTLTKLFTEYDFLDVHWLKPEI